MAKGILRFLIGQTTFALHTENENASVLAAVNRLRQEFLLYDMRVGEGELRFSCRLSNTKKIEKILREENIVFSKKSYGVASLLSRLAGKSGISVGLALAALMHMWCMGHVWDIRVIGNESVPTEEILDRLERLGFYRGCRLKDVDVDRLYLSYLPTDERIAWLHINMWGVTANVEVSERKAEPKREPDKKELCNIVAKCDGVVLETDVYSGGKEVSAGDSVVKGQLLISSFFETRMSGYLLRRARGRVLAQTEPIFEMHIPKVYRTVTPQERREKTSVVLLCRELPLLGQGKNVSEFCRRAESERTITLFSRLKMPFSVKTESFTPLCVEERRRDKEEARSLYYKRLATWKNEYAENAEFLYEETTESEEKDTYVFVTRFLCREDISSEKVLRMNGWEFDKPT